MLKLVCSTQGQLCRNSGIHMGIYLILYEHMGVYLGVVEYVVQKCNTYICNTTLYSPQTEHGCLGGQIQQF